MRVNQNCFLEFKNPYNEIHKINIIIKKQGFTV